MAVAPQRVEKPVAENEKPSRAASLFDWMAPPPIETENTLNVFQPGLRRGAARLPFAPHKRYAYVEHPTEGWRVYLRATCFLHEMFRPLDPRRFIVVKRTGGDPTKATWEPPKGQMEGKDAPKGDRRSVLQLLKDNVRREVAEEAKIERIRELRHTGLVLQSVEPDFPENTYFQYHIFQGYVHPTQLAAAVQEFEWIEQHPEEFKKLKSDVREKDGIGWFSDLGGAAVASTKKMMGRWSPTLVKMYLENSQYH